MRGKSNRKTVIIGNSLLMCIIMSLNVNEMELKERIQSFRTKRKRLRREEGCQKDLADLWRQTFHKHTNL